MYSRTVDGEVREFGVSGKLWHGVLVMFDRASDSLWTQLDGRAIQGSALGQRLDHVPSTFTTWSRWRQRHPNTLVLEKDEEARERSGTRYADYFADPDRLFFEHLDEDLGGIGPKDTVYGVVVEGAALAVTERLLVSQGTALAVVGGRPVAFLRDSDTGAVIAADARFEGRVLVPEVYGSHNPAELFRDALSLEVHGPDELEPVRVDRAFWYAWKRTHPESRALTD